MAVVGMIFGKGTFDICTFISFHEAEAHIGAPGTELCNETSDYLEPL